MREYKVLMEVTRQIVYGTLLNEEVTHTVGKKGSKGRAQYLTTANSDLFKQFDSHFSKNQEFDDRIDPSDFLEWLEDTNTQIEDKFIKLGFIEPKSIVPDAEHICDQIEKSKMIIAAERDRLRNLLSDLESILDSVNDTMEMFDDGLEDIRTGLDRLSEYL